jgi:hypothetical protein
MLIHQFSSKKSGHDFEQLQAPAHHLYNAAQFTLLGKNYLSA